jgi:hypothetical protein
MCGHSSFLMERATNGHLVFCSLIVDQEEDDRSKLKWSLLLPPWRKRRRGQVIIRGYKKIEWGLFWVGWEREKTRWAAVPQIIIRAWLHEHSHFNTSRRSRSPTRPKLARRCRWLRWWATQMSKSNRWVWKLNHGIGRRCIALNVD